MNHAASVSRRRKLGRRGLITLLIATLLLGTGIAWAIYVLFLKVNGNITGSSVSVVWGAPSATGTDSSCTASKNAAGDVVVNITNAYPGAKCDVSSFVTKGAGSTEDLVVVDVDTWTLPTGWTATLTMGKCATVDAGGKQVVFQLKHDGTGTVGQGALSGNVKVVPFSQKAAAGC